IPYQDYVSRISPGDQQIAAYYKKNQESFREPERVRIAFIHYEPLTMAAKYTPTDQEIEVYYKRNENSRFTHPDLVHARHILITVPEGATPNEKATAKAKAQDVLEQATKPGADFPKLASKYSEDPSNRLKGGDLGSFGRGQMIKPFEDAVFSMKPGEIRMVETKFGYHVVKLEEFKPAHVDTLQEARPAIIQALRNDAGTKLAREAVDQDVAAALGGLSLQDVAKKRDLDTVETPPFARNESIKGAENDRNLVEAAFKLEPGQVRAIPSGGAPYLVKLIERQPSRIPPLNEITAKVRDVYIRSTAQSEAREQAQKLLEQIKTPDDFGKVATQNKLLIHNDAPFSRTANSVPGIGEFPEVSEAAGLVAKVPGVIQHVMEQDGNSYLFELNSRSDPDDQEWKSAEQSFTDEYLSRRRAEAWTHFLDDLKSRADIVIHTDQIGESPAESSM
ncbi:MAG TPA: peptidylprolyl isomerase, partial [Candidatus Binataceae bacterium]